MTSLRTRIWRAYEAVAMCLGLGALAVVCLTWLPFAMVLSPLLPQRIGQRIGRYAIFIGLRIYLIILRVLCACRFDFGELDSLRHGGPVVVVANHPSLLDAVLILSRLPNAVCVMKASILDNILFGAAARMARYIRNDVPFKMIRDARKELAEGAQLVIFPEGSRTRLFPLDRCMPTAGLIAARAKAPVQALLIEFSTPYLGKAWPLAKPPSLPLSCRIRLGRCFSPPTDVSAFTAELEAHLRAELGATETAEPAPQPASA
ncbi:lysophospholipid acyltransferase family protein [Thauera butanivorans]|uniref:lysophospholipid acyltransferase family protein n=1 Tax=Thauera butanivorans TaxID=86174 RepID=UPI000839A7AF|nr:lysophospholipid acyltransferase family protein [Thauera butanivorans]